MSDDDLTQLDALANAASSGPWSVGPHHVSGQVTEVVGGSGQCVMDDREYYPQWVSVEDMKFCAAARTAVPALVAEVRRLRALVEAAYREGVDACEGYIGTDSEHARLLAAWEQSAARKALSPAPTPE